MTSRSIDLGFVSIWLVHDLERTVGINTPAHLVIIKVSHTLHVLHAGYEMHGLNIGLFALMF